MTALDSDRLVVDLLDPELYRRNPHDVWAWMRANEPVYRDHRNGLWGVTRHADLMDVERRSSVFVSGQGYRAIWSPEEINMIAQDDPRHRQQRMLVQHKLTRAGVAERLPAVQALVSEVVGEWASRTESEVIHDLAGQIPARLTCNLLGYPEEMWERLKKWSEDLMRVDMRERDGDTFASFFDANIDFATEFGKLAPAKYGCPVDDFMSIWLHAQIDGAPLSPEAIVHEIGLFIAGGAETTRTAISHGLRAFCDHPDQWNALAADPSLVPGAVEEVLRWVTPLNQMFRRVVTDDHIGDQAVRRGDRVIMLYPSANRDEAVFNEPFMFDIRRSPNPQIAFGFGTHLCVGANLARATLVEVFTQLPKLITNLRPVTEPDVEPNIFARAVRSFCLGYDLR
jgi:cholest-4-en-3-one 26-monooxygenase